MTTVTSSIKYPHHHLHQYSAANATNVQQVQSANVNNFAHTPFPPSSPYANHGNIGPAHFELAPQRPARSHDVQFTRRRTFDPLGRVPQMASSPATSNMLQEIVKLFGEAYPELLDLHAVEAFADELESIGNFASRVRKLAKDLADRAEYQSAASGYSINAQPSPISSSQFFDNTGSGMGNYPVDATHLTGTVSSPWSPHGDQRFGPAAYPSISVNQWPTKDSPSPAFHSRNASGQGRSAYASLSLARNSDFMMVCPQERMMQRELCVAKRVLEIEEWIWEGYAKAGAQRSILEIQLTDKSYIEGHFRDDCRQRSTVACCPSFIENITAEHRERATVVYSTVAHCGEVKNWSRLRIENMVTVACQRRKRDGLGEGNSRADCTLKRVSTRYRYRAGRFHTEEGTVRLAGGCIWRSISILRPIRGGACQKNEERRKGVAHQATDIFAGCCFGVSTLQIVFKHRYMKLGDSALSFAEWRREVQIAIPARATYCDGPGKRVRYSHNAIANARVPIDHHLLRHSTTSVVSIPSFTMPTSASYPSLSPDESSTGDKTRGLRPQGIPNGQVEDNRAGNVAQKKQAENTLQDSKAGGDEGLFSKEEMEAMLASVGNWMCDPRQPPVRGGIYGAGYGMDGLGHGSFRAETNGLRGSSMLRKTHTVNREQGMQMVEGAVHSVQTSYAGPYHGENTSGALSEGPPKQDATSADYTSLVKGGGHTSEGKPTHYDSIPPTLRK
ncbi:hypothetical protein WOLCODRAFT_19900 [Wolfiporia cocos MD-104 SS10]|uniref:Uncharacterized protein n=1 Tax=Wolfiporia cocos (strain MD-104) TaxID=742152 RepID=A0A2H3J004_WOLCO|nr:hypothetical protein WOLCODRAFT_19900 [Wolfiporia cocos MD-104 SS10]